MIQVLVADDDRLSRYLLVKLLEEWGFETVEAGDGAEALRLMREKDPPRLLLLDLEMPKVDGLEVCRYLRRTESLNPPYIIFLTAHRDSDQMVRVFEAGASDYISKPCNWDELRARVRVGERTLRLQDQLHAARHEMQELAMRDALTGLYNRRAIAERLEEELLRFRGSGEGISIALADIDRFKEVNDTFGHQAGDRVLIEFAKAVRRTLRRTDLIGRWGGDEFLFLVFNQEGEESCYLFERIRMLAAQLRVPFEGREIGITTSIGVAIAGPEETADEILRRADLALYSVKRSGRNAVAFALPAAEGLSEVGSGASVI